VAGPPACSNVAAHTELPQALRPSLAKGSICDHQEGEWRVALYTDAGEATVTRIPYWWDWWKCPKHRQPVPPASGNTNGLRARTKVRRFCRANRCAKLLTLTYADEPADRATVDRHIHEWLITMRRWFGHPPLVCVIEEGAEKGRFHVHVGIDRWYDYDVLWATWWHGYIWIGGKKGRRRPKIGNAIDLANYLAKYIAKDQEPTEQGSPRQRSPGKHRYHVSRGHAPQCTRQRFRTQEAAASWLLAAYGVAPRSMRYGDWDGDQSYGIWLQYALETINAHLPPPGYEMGNSGGALP
jgi:hypothetical protein